jgi:two-component system nitrate/nitrite response regulator NarL
MTNATQPQIRVLIVDDHAIVRAGLRMLIDNQPSMKVVEMAGNPADALAFAARESPEIILLDLDLAGHDALGLIPELRAVAKRARILVLTALKDLQAHRRAMRLGAMGVVLKDQAAETLIKAIEKVHRGEVWIDRLTMGSLIDEMTQTAEPDPEELKIESLTRREREVINLIAEGLKNKQIGERLFIGETTVTHHLSAIFSKLEVSDRLELVIYAFSRGLAQMPPKAARARGNRHQKPDFES